MNSPESPIPGPAHDSSHHKGLAIGRVLVGGIRVNRSRGGRSRGPDRVRAVLWSEHGVRVGSRTASEILDAVEQADPLADHLDVSDGNTRVLLTRAEILALLGSDPSKDGNQ